MRSLFFKKRLFKSLLFIFFAFVFFSFFFDGKGLSLNRAQAGTCRYDQWGACNSIRCVDTRLEKSCCVCKFISLGNYDCNWTWQPSAWCSGYYQWVCNSIGIRADYWLFSYCYNNACHFPPDAARPVRILDTESCPLLATAPFNYYQCVGDELQHKQRVYVPWCDPATGRCKFSETEWQPVKTCDNQWYEYQCAGEGNNIKQRMFVEEACDANFARISDGSCRLDYGIWEDDEDCKDDYLIYQCSDNKRYIEQMLIERGCADGECFVDESNPWQTIFDCGQDYYDPWQPDYCAADDDVYHDATFHDLYCDDSGASPSCGDSTSTETELVRSCSAGCLSANCKPWVKSAASGEQINCATKGVVYVPLQWLYYDDEGDKQVKYQIKVFTDPSYADEFKVADFSGSQVLSNGELGTVNVEVVLVPTQPNQVEYRGPGNFYYWQIQVEDNTGNKSDWIEGKKFDTPSHPYPYVYWDYSPKPVNIGEIISTINSSECYDSAGNIVECKSYRWSVDPPGASFDYASGNQASFQPQFIFNEKKQYIVTLTVKDDANQVCAKWQPINAGYPLPTWKEIKPF